MSYSSFFDIAKDFKVIMLDSYGVVKNHKGLIHGVEKTINWIKSEEKSFKLLTNDASRSQEQQQQSLAKLGLTNIELGEIITSGMMAKHFLEHKITDGHIAYLGTEKRNGTRVASAGCGVGCVSNEDLTCSCCSV